eukprot:GILJ01009238.1.p1 GENE.GILJ01009238.1~~GILJ01009238.1.p1  ORF type:complete len:879 (+),score=98.65 GILJ01009238.1:1961-4597(+)
MTKKRKKDKEQEQEHGQEQEQGRKSIVQTRLNDQDLKDNKKNKGKSKEAGVGEVSKTKKTRDDVRQRKSINENSKHTTVKYKLNKLWHREEYPLLREKIDDLVFHISRLAAEATHIHTLLIHHLLDLAEEKDEDDDEKGKKEKQHIKIRQPTNWSDVKDPNFYFWTMAILVKPDFRPRKGCVIRRPEALEHLRVVITKYRAMRRQYTGDLRRTPYDGQILTMVAQQMERNVRVHWSQEKQEQRIIKTMMAQMTTYDEASGKVQKPKQWLVQKTFRMLMSTCEFQQVTTVNDDNGNHNPCGEERKQEQIMIETCQRHHQWLFTVGGESDGDSEKQNDGQPPVKRQRTGLSTAHNTYTKRLLTYQDDPYRFCLYLRTMQQWREGNAASKKGRGSKSFPLLPVSNIGRTFITIDKKVLGELMTSTGDVERLEDSLRESGQLDVDVSLTSGEIWALVIEHRSWEQVRNVQLPSSTTVSSSSSSNPTISSNSIDSNLLSSSSSSPSPPSLSTERNYWKRGWQNQRTIQTDGVQLAIPLLRPFETDSDKNVPKKHGRDGRKKASGPSNNTTKDDPPTLIPLSSVHKGGHLIPLQRIQPLDDGVHADDEYRLVSIDPGRRDLITACFWDRDLDKCRFVRLSRSQYYTGGGITAGARKRNFWINRDPHLKEAMASLSRDGASCRTSSPASHWRYIENRLKHDQVLWEAAFHQRHSNISFRQHMLKNRCLDRFINEHFSDPGTLVLMGDAQFSVTARGQLTGKTKSLTKRISHVAPVVMVDEFRTSKMCGRCEEPLKKVWFPSRTRRYRFNPAGEHQPVLGWKRDDPSVFEVCCKPRREVCPWSLRRCSTTGCRSLTHRDHNASFNIGLAFVSVVEGGGRPPFLSHQ